MTAPARPEAVQGASSAGPFPLCATLPIAPSVPPPVRLTLLGDRVYLDREKSDERSVLNLFGRQQIALIEAETDTSDLERKGGRFLPFERCGVDSTWMLSFPAAVEAIEGGGRRSRHRTALEKLEDVVIEIRYTARVGK